MKSAAGDDDRLKIHATAVAISGAGIMIRGESGSGKSDLALRMIDRGATLIADDCVDVERKDKILLLNCPTNLVGKLEVRSLGIMDCEHVSGVELKLIVDLKQDPDRFPLDQQVMNLLGIAVPICTLNPMESSAAIKAEWALKRILKDAANS